MCPVRLPELQLGGTAGVRLLWGCRGAGSGCWSSLDCAHGCTGLAWGWCGAGSAAPSPELHPSLPARSSSPERWGAAPEGSPCSPPGSAPPLRSPRWPQPGSGLARRAPQLHLLPLHSPTCPFEHTMFPFLLSPFLFLGKDPWVSRPCLAQPAFGLHFILFFRLRT